MADRVSQSVPEEIYVDKYTVVCGGPRGEFGHPQVALSLEKGQTVSCPYCSQRFVRVQRGSVSQHGA
jgi:uncharacterized Zn-finger protein